MPRGANFTIWFTLLWRSCPKARVVHENVHYMFKYDVSLCMIVIFGVWLHRLTYWFPYFLVWFLNFYCFIEVWSFDMLKEHVELSFFPMCFFQIDFFFFLFFLRGLGVGWNFDHANSFRVILINVIWAFTKIL
jgi:hypothetical protein